MGHNPPTSQIHKKFPTFGLVDGDEDEGEFEALAGVQRHQLDGVVALLDGAPLRAYLEENFDVDRVLRYMCTIN